MENLVVKTPLLCKEKINFHKNSLCLINPYQGTLFKTIWVCIFWDREKCWYYVSIVPCKFYTYFYLHNGEIITETYKNLYEHYNEQH